MKTKTRIPAALTAQEWKIMELLWAKPSQPAYDLIAVLSPREKIAANTVRTMLARLVKKGAVTAQPYKNLFLYSAAVGRARFVEKESQSFLQRVFGGALRPALIHFVSRQRLSPEDVAEMKRILDQNIESQKK